MKGVIGRGFCYETSDLDNVLHILDLCKKTDKILSICDISQSCQRRIRPRSCHRLAAAQRYPKLVSLES